MTLIGSLMDDDTLRQRILDAHPEWKGRIWIYKTNRFNATLKGVGNVCFCDTAEQVITSLEEMERS